MSNTEKCSNEIYLMASIMKLLQKNSIVQETRLQDLFQNSKISSLRKFNIFFVILYTKFTLFMHSHAIVRVLFLCYDLGIKEWVN